MNIISILKRAPKRLMAIIAMVAISAIIPATLFAWGPKRDTFTMEVPAGHVTFNSITNNPNIGDERNFVGIREKNIPNVWFDKMNVEKGKEYVVRMYVHNNAAENLNLVAENVTASFNLPTETAKSIQVNGFINSTNATPTEVYDHATFTSNEIFNLAYIDGSLLYENNSVGKNGGVALSESIFTSTGVKLGYDKLDGKIQGCIQYSGYVSFRVKPQFVASSDYIVSKKVSKHDAFKFVESYTAKPGEIVDFLIDYENTGEIQHNDVIIRDVLPAGMTYIIGSTTYGNANFPEGVKAVDDITNTTGVTGINVGSYAPGANAWVVFSARVVDNDDLGTCGKNTLTNIVRISTDGQTKQDTANVTVEKHCKPDVPPVTPPVTPPTVKPVEKLPVTGTGDNITAFLGFGSLVTSLGYYLKSRRGSLVR